MIRYVVRFYDMTAPGDGFMFQRVQDQPEKRTRLPGIPVRVECEELPPPTHKREQRHELHRL